MVSLTEEGDIKEARYKQNNIIIFYSALRKILKPQLKNMSVWHKAMCEFECPISYKSVNDFLLKCNIITWINLNTTSTILKTEVMVKSKFVFLKPIIMLSHIQKASADMAMATRCSFPYDQNYFPQWKIVLRCCVKCKSIVITSQ